MATPPAAPAADDTSGEQTTIRPDWREEYRTWAARERRPGGELYDPADDPYL